MDKMLEMTGVQHSILKQALNKACLRLTNTIEYSNKGYRFTFQAPANPDTNLFAYGIIAHSSDTWFARSSSDVWIDIELILTRKPVRVAEAVIAIENKLVDDIVEGLKRAEDYIRRQEAEENLRDLRKDAFAKLVAFAKGEEQSFTQKQAQIVVDAINNGYFIVKGL